MGMGKNIRDEEADMMEFSKRESKKMKVLSNM